MHRLLFFLHPPQHRWERWLNGFWIALLYLTGILHWCLFLNWGKIPFELHDWKQSGSFYSFLRAAALTDQLPLHTDARFVRTERYLAMPNAPFSPQNYLLRFLDIGPFTLVNVLFFFSLGCLGLLLLRKRYFPSPLAFTLVFLLFNFNGHITAHLAVGHVEWVGYFLSPFIILLVLELMDGKIEGLSREAGSLWRQVRRGLGWMFGARTGWQWSLWLALAFLGLFLQGAFHFALWYTFFLLAFGLTRREFLPLVLRALLFGALLSALRILPAAMQFAGGGVDFVSGFPTLVDFLAALVVLKPPEQSQAWAWQFLGWWEVDTYIGGLGLIFLTWFGLVHTWRKGGIQRSLLVPIFVIFLLSIGIVYKAITLLPLPLLDSERVTSRFFIVSFLFLLTLAGRNFEDWLRTRPSLAPAQVLLALAGTLLLAHDLFQHSRLWRVVKMYNLFNSKPADLTSQVIYYPDPPYYTALIAGLVVMLLALIFLILQVRRERKDRKPA